MRRYARWMLLAGSAVAAVLLPLAGMASITGGCTGSITIDGVTYGPENDTPSNPIVIPDDPGVVAEWEGEVPFANTNNSGEIGIVVGANTIPVVSWEEANPDDTRSGSGTYGLDDLKAALPVDVGIAGIYQLRGFHQADGGRCEGEVFVRFDGNPLGTPLGIVAAAGLGLSAIGMIGAMVRKGG